MDKCHAYSIGHLFCNIACSPEVGFAFAFWEQVADVTDGLGKGVESSDCHTSETGLEFGKYHLDRVQVRAVRRQEEHPVGPVAKIALVGN